MEEHEAQGKMSGTTGKKRMLHTMFRVGDLQKSIDFYTTVLNMRLLRTWDCPEDKYTLAFLGYGTELEATVLELTYNYGESRYTHGSAFGHICIGVENVDAEVEKCKALGVEIDYHSTDGFMAFIVDPDGYYIELLNEEMMMGKASKAMSQ